MFLVLVLSFPLVLLALLLGMERVEKPLYDPTAQDELDSFVAAATPEELETMVSAGYAAAVDRYWRRRRRARRARRAAAAGMSQAPR